MFSKLRIALFVFLLFPVLIQAKEKQITLGGISEIVQIIDTNSVEYFSFSQIASSIGGILDWEKVGYTITYTDDSLKLRFLVGSPYFFKGDKSYNFIYPACLRDGQLFLPSETFLPFFTDKSGSTQPVLTSAVKGEDSRLDRTSGKSYTVPDIGFATKANGLLIEIALSEARAYDIFITEGNWLNVSIRDAQIDARQVLSRLDKRYLYDLKVHQQGSTGQISMRLKQNIKTWHHTLKQDPPTIQISFVDENFTPPTISAPPAGTPPTLSVDKVIDVIIVDAGHGGVDYGAIGPGGKREKDVTLSIAKELVKLLKADTDFKVIMTRDRDKSVSLQERAEIANNAGADLFVSIHANASPKSAARGWNVFFLAPAKNDSARAAEQFENSFFLREQNSLLQHQQAEEKDSSLDPVSHILNEMLMTEFQDESEKFAMMLERKMRALPIRNRGVDQAGFFVLNKVFMPSVLIESGFITNRNEEKVLTSQTYQQTLAQAIYDAIKQFKKTYE